MGRSSSPAAVSSYSAAALAPSRAGARRRAQSSSSRLDSSDRRNERHAAADVVEAAPARNELPHDDERPALGQQLAGLRNWAELAVSAHTGMSRKAIRHTRQMAGIDRASSQLPPTYRVLELVPGVAGSRSDLDLPHAPFHGPASLLKSFLMHGHGNTAAANLGRRCAAELVSGVFAGTLHKPGRTSLRGGLPHLECDDRAPPRSGGAPAGPRPMWPRRSASPTRIGLPLSVRGGGHNVAGAALSDGGITIDMSQRRARQRRSRRAVIVRVEPGATWKDVDAATQPHGLVVPSGIISATGVAGFTLGAGFGWTSRKFGFAADNLVSAEVVTADGKDPPSERERRTPDLFWALRGGSGNFGVVTEFEFRAHRHGPQALCGMVVHPFERARDVMRLYREVTAGRARRTHLLSSSCARRRRRRSSRRNITASRSPPSWRTGPAIPPTERRRCSRSKRSAPPIADTIAPKDFIAFQTVLDGGQPFGRRYYWKSARGERSLGRPDRQRSPNARAGSRRPSPPSS